MFYCDDCRIKNKWPSAFTYSVGKCECCGVSARCWDRPSSTLPPVEFTKYDRAPSSAPTAGRQSIVPWQDRVKGHTVHEYVDLMREEIAEWRAWAARSAGDAVPVTRNIFEHKRIGEFTVQVTFRSARACGKFIEQIGAATAPGNAT